jgi:hypothetical protein
MTWRMAAVLKDVGFWAAAGRTQRAGDECGVAGVAVCFSITVRHLWFLALAPYNASNNIFSNVIAI